jgi:hypothetical protein
MDWSKRLLLVAWALLGLLVLGVLLWVSVMVGGSE